MTVAVDNLVLLERALAQAGRVIAAISPEQASLPTPCGAWDVQALVRHVVTQDMGNFTVAARGETPDWQAPAGELSDDWAGQFDEGAEQLLAAWREGDPDRAVAMPGGSEAPLRTRANTQIAEFALHAWDLVKATGQQADLDPAVAEHSLEWGRQMLRPEYRGPDKAFGVEVAVPDDAPVYDRLAGWFGRDPRWTAPRG